MSADLTLEFGRRPSAAVYMLRALYPSAVLSKVKRAPPIRAIWRNHRVDPRELGDFLELTGLRADAGLPLLYPHVFGFRLQLAVLTHRSFPLPIWNALQIRNHLLQHRPIPTNAVLDLETRVAGQRILEKGMEVDLRTSVRSGYELLWESLNTFYYRGRYGEPSPASPLARAADVGETVVAQWRTSSGVGRRLGRLTGDYNGLHLSSGYARMFGFRRAFQHPQLVLGQCMARLPALGEAFPQKLDAWLKGPVFYDCDVALRASVEAGGTSFGIVPEGEERAAIVGRCYACPAGSVLVNERDEPL